jgi:dienelactone hydrolase
MGRPRRSCFPIIAAAVLLSGCGAAEFGICAPHIKEEGTPKRNWTECFDRPVAHTGITHSVLCLNDSASKPPVLLLHELTGLTPGTLAYAEELSKDFTVYVPLLFGEKGARSPASGLWAYWFRGTVEFFPGGEWGVPSRGSPPIVHWLRAVTQTIEARHSQQRIGIIGNCMTGPLPVALLDNPQVGAAVVAQPALPMRFWWSTETDKQSLGLSADDLQSARSSTAKIYGLRFETDCMSDASKLRTLRDEFGNRFLDGTIPADSYQKDGRQINAHSTLIGSWKARDPDGQASRDARARVRTFLLKELSGIRPEN